MATLRIRQLPALNGLRALAVLAVLCYHGELSWAAGGFLGVDAFFVISGFLITALLLGEWKHSGTIALGAFWARRARRLLPALFVVLGAVAIYAVAWASPDALRQIRGDGYAALGYVANWRFIFGGQSYFAQFAAPSPLKHVWSLAIEEQFYLAWPLIVVAILRFRRGSLRTLAGVTLGMLLTSVALMFVMYHPGHDPSRVYYGTDTRAQSLLVGALLAMVLMRLREPRQQRTLMVLHGSALAAAAVLGWSWVATSETSSFLYRGGFLLEAVLVGIVIASVTQRRQGPLGIALSWWPLQWIGLISYGLYLWHWPVYVVLSPQRTHIGGYELFALRVAVTFLFATVSYYLIEQPIRRGALHGWRVRIATPAVAAGTLTAIMVTTAGAVAPREISASELRPPAPRTVVAGATATAPAPMRVLLVGDSMMNSLAPGLDRLAASQHFVSWNASIPGCGLSSDAGEQYTNAWTPASPRCFPGWHERWPKHIAQYHPDVVVALLGTHDTFDRLINGHDFRFDSTEGAQLARDELQQAVTILSAEGAPVVLLTSAYNVMGWPQPVTVSRSQYNPRWVDRWNELLRETAAANPGRVQVLDLNRFLDPNGHWTDTVNGVHVRGPDLMHLNDAGADVTAQWLLPQLLMIRAGACYDVAHPPGTRTQTAVHRPGPACAHAAPVDAFVDATAGVQRVAASARSERVDR